MFNSYRQQVLTKLLKFHLATASRESFTTANAGSKDFLSLIHPLHDRLLLLLMPCK
jgi:hypothetical protein